MCARPASELWAAGFRDVCRPWACRVCLWGRSSYGPAWRCLFQPTLPQDEPFESRAHENSARAPLLSPLSNLFCLAAAAACQTACYRRRRQSWRSTGRRVRVCVCVCVCACVRACVLTVFSSVFSLFFLLLFLVLSGPGGNSRPAGWRSSGLCDGDSQAFSGLTFHTPRSEPRESCQLCGVRPNCPNFSRFPTRPLEGGVGVGLCCIPPGPSYRV